MGVYRNDLKMGAVSGKALRRQVSESALMVKSVYRYKEMVYMVNKS